MDENIAFLNINLAESYFQRGKFCVSVKDDSPFPKVRAAL